MAYTTSDIDIIKAEVLRDVVYKRAEELLVGKNAIPVRGIRSLDIKLSVPTATYLEPDKVAEGSLADVKELTWMDITGSLEKYQGVVRITDESIIRQLDDVQMQKSVDAVARGLAIKKDEEIFNAITSSAGQLVNATATWDDANADPVGDIASALEKILENTVLTTEDFNNIGLFVPVGGYANLTRLAEINNITQSYVDYIRNAFGIKIYPTRQLSTDAYMVVNSDETGVHYQYEGNSQQLPTVEMVREEGVGWKYLITQFFKTIIIPDTSGGSTTSMICKIAGVMA